MSIFKTQRTHQFNTEDAEKHGVIGAIILSNLRYWVEKNKANRKNVHDGRYWTYNTLKAFSELFSYLKETQIKYALKKLKDDGVIFVKQFNKGNCDRTNWYSINEDWTKEFAEEGEDLPDEIKLSHRIVKTVKSKGEDYSIDGIKLSPDGVKLSPRGGKIIPSSYTNINNTNINTDINLESSEQTQEVCSGKKAEQKIVIDIGGNEEVNNIISSLSTKTQEAIIELYNDTEFIKREFIKMGVWLDQNKRKAPKSNYTRFVMNWLDRGWETYRKTILSKHIKRNFAQENADKIKGMKNPYDI
jgi:DNA-binding PadR family transcriptional regulator